MINFAGQARVEISIIMDVEMDDNNVIIKEESRCFVCDASVRGRYYALATCRTQNSQTRVIEKLGELVGERYMVVISEDDVICRSCAILVNTLDRLETEMEDVRSHVLRFLERKYFLEDGELRGDRPKPCQPPQITRSNANEVINYSCNSTKKRSEIRYDKTRKRSHSWLRCDRCRYTTRPDSFAMHHSKDRVVQGQKVSRQQYGSWIVGKEAREEITVHQSDEKDERDNTDANIARSDSDSTGKMLQSTLLSAQVPPPGISLASNDHVYISGMLPANAPATLKQPMYILQPINVDVSRKITVKSVSPQETEGRGQTLTLMEDGSLGMMEVALLG